DDAMASFRTICDLLIGSGYELHRIPVMGDFQEIRNRHDVILSAEAAQVHAGWFEKYRDLYSPKFIDLVRQGRKITDEQLHTALKAREEFRDQMNQIMNKSNIDLWICPPTIGPAPRGLDSTGDPVMNLPWTQIGFPTVNLPTSKTKEGLPMGVQIIGKWGADEELLAWSEEIEKVAGWK
ncbi:MAG: amidase family protein, partial [Anaerolineales bacterium]